MASKNPSAQKVAHSPSEKHPPSLLQAIPHKACSQVRKKLRSTAQLLAHISNFSYRQIGQNRHLHFISHWFIWKIYYVARSL